MTQKFDISNVSKLDNAKRRAVLPPEEILQKIGISEGEIFADIGCGIGYFSLPAAKMIGESGVVYSLDISTEMLKMMEEKIQLEGLANVRTIKSEEYHLPLPDDMVTVVFTCNVVHEVEDKVRFIGEMKRVLKNDGRLILIEWEKMESDYGPPIDHRIDKTKIQDMIVSLGFREIKAGDLNEYFYVIAAKK